MDVIKEINTVLPILKRRFGISRIGVFGSYSTGTASPESDIDILVTFQEGQETFDNYMDLKFYLEDSFNKKVDLVIEDSIKTRLKDRIMRETLFA